MKRPAVLEGTYESNRRKLEYWTRCEHCPERKNCRHECDRPGWWRFFIDGKPTLFVQGVITLGRLKTAVHKHLECEPDKLPDDVRMAEQLRMEFEV